MSTAWQEFSTPEGRKYWFHPATQKSVWEKPEELKSPIERLLDMLPWKEFTAKDGRKYWHNKLTQQSTWTCPPEITELTEKMRHEVIMPVDRVPVSAKLENLKSPISAADEVIPDFQTKEEAEEAFIALLTEHNVGSDWSWERCMRSLIQYPMYKSLKTVVERKEAFEKYQFARRRAEREEARMSLEKRRADFTQLLKDSIVGPHSRFSSFAQVYSQHPAWLAFPKARDCEDMFEEYVYTLRKAEKEAEREVRIRNRDKIVKILESANVTELMRWKDFVAFYTQHSIYTEDEELQKCDPIEFLTAFEDTIKRLEAIGAATRRKEREERLRRERHIRDAYRQLLDELRVAGTFNVNSKWKELFPLIKDDERFLHVLGQTRPSPMEVYRDNVVDMEEEVYQNGKAVQKILRESGFILSPATEFEKFCQHLEEQECKVSMDQLKVIFEVLVDKAASKEKAHKRREEKRMRYMWEDFKYYAHKAQISDETTFDNVQRAISRKMDISVDTLKEFLDRYLKRLKRDYEVSADGDDQRKVDYKRHRTESYTREYSRPPRIDPSMISTEPEKSAEEDYDKKLMEYRTRTPSPMEDVTIDYDG